MNNKRFYNFTIIIYEDDELFFEQFANLSNMQRAIWIRHDKDENEDTGELKKAHYHFVLHLTNARTISSLAKEINVAENMIEPIKKSLKGALKYLIHYGYDSKYQYSPEDVKSNNDKFKRKFMDAVSVEEPEVDKVITIQDFIENYPTSLEIGVLGRYVQKINQWDAFRRNLVYFCKLVDSHNAKYFGEKYHISCNLD